MDEIECKTADLLKEYIILHERIKALYKMLDIHKYIHWYWLESSHVEKKNYWKDYHDVVKNTININTFCSMKKCKEDMENTSIRNNKIREIKNEIKRYHRMQSNIQTVLVDARVRRGGIKKIFKQYGTEEVPSQFKNDMNYIYCVPLF